MTWTLFAENPAHEFQSISRLHEAVHGTKRGRAILAARAGISERRLRAILFEGARPYADEFGRALDAQRVARAERAGKLRAELAALEGYADDNTARMDGLLVAPVGALR